MNAISWRPSVRNALATTLCGVSRRSAVIGWLTVFVMFGCFDGGGNVRRGWLSATDGASLEHLDSLGVHVRELRRFKLDEPALSNVSALAEWGDGTIWLASQSGETIWELGRAASQLRRVREDGDQPGGFGRALAMVPMSDGGVLLVGSNGVQQFSDRFDSGAFHSFNRFMVRGLAVFDNGDYVISYGQYPDDPHVAYSLHRFGRDGTHQSSWHPAFSHEDWRLVPYLSGGPVTVTDDGDLLALEAAPFRITRYEGGLPGSGDTLLEDETILSISELQRALGSGNGSYSPQWNQSVLLDEIEGGLILSVVKETTGDRRRWQSLWIVASPGGVVMARTRVDRYYWFMTPLASGHYLGFHDGDLVELDVTLGAFE